jgi:CheY-like chemotaxis protein
VFDCLVFDVQLRGMSGVELQRQLAASGSSTPVIYIKVTPGETEASDTDWRLGADYYFFRNAGLGVQYKYNKYTYAGASNELGGQGVYRGLQVFLSFLS